MTEIRKEYAEALFALAREQGQEEAVFTALQLIATELEKAPEYETLLSSPNIPIGERSALIIQAFAPHVPEDVLFFTLLLCKKGHIRQFAQCVKAYEKLYYAQKSISQVRVVSAAALTDTEKKVLIEKLTNTSGRTIAAQYEIDEAMLGGITIYMEDQVIDGSLRHKIEEIKEVIYK